MNNKALCSGLYVLIAITLLMAITGSVYAQDSNIRLVTPDEAGIQQYLRVNTSTISSDGNIVAFSGMARNYADIPWPKIDQVYVKDLAQNKLEIVSVNNAGQPAENAPNDVQPARLDDMSSDGRYVLFSSRATNLVDNDTNGLQDVFVRDRLLGTTERVDIATDGSVANAGGEGLRISDDGNLVFFTSSSTNLDPSGVPYGTYVHNRKMGITKKLTYDDNGTIITAVYGYSNDGRYVVFPDFGNLIIYGVEDGSIEKIDITQYKNTYGYNTLGTVSFDPSGRYLAFIDMKVDASQTPMWRSEDIFVYDRKLKQLERIGSGYVPSQWPANQPKSPFVTSDGRYIVYNRSLYKYINGVKTLITGIEQYDLETGSKKIIVSGDGTSYLSYLRSPLISDSPKFLFQSVADDLVSNDTDLNAPDAFIYGMSNVIGGTSTNTDPVANINTTNQNIELCSSSTAQVVLDGSGSSDPDGDTLTYTWSGSFGTLTGTQVTVTLPAGVYPITLTVNDGRGGTSTATTTITVSADTVAPTVDAGPDVVLERTTAEGAAYTPHYTVSDNCGTPSVSVSPTPAYYPLGSTLVTVTAVDAQSNTASDTMTVTVKDTTAPVLTIAPSFTLEATSSQGALLALPYQVSDLCGCTSVTYDPASTFLSIGTHSIDVIATDDAGNVTRKTVQVTVQDTTPPTLTAPGDISVEGTGPLTQVDLGSAIADDLVDGSITATNNAPAGGFPVGTTVVTWTATDGSGNVTTATQNVTITDTVAPTLTVPATLNLEATDSSGALLSLSDITYTASDVCDPNVQVSLSTNQCGMGSTVVIVTACDASGNCSSQDMTVNVVDTTPPVLTVPAPVTMEATGPITSVDLGNATATDLVDGSVTATNNAPAGGFPVGTTTVTWTATDAAGNVATATQTVTVQDTTPPTLTVPGTLTVEATGPNTSVNLGNATATDLVDGSVTPTNNAPAGGFPVGTTTVTWTATDAAGNSSTATQTVTVVDTTPPALSIPGPLTVEATGPLTQVNLGGVTATDLVDGPVAVSNNAPAGGFPLGTTVVTYTATDSSGNTSTGTQAITVVDTTPPALSVPGDLTIEATGPLTPVNLGNASATDLVDGPVDVSNNAPAGGFPLGTTTVTYTATDSSGNTSTATQRVTVQDTTPPSFDYQQFEDTLWPPNHKFVKVAEVSNVHDLVDGNPTVNITVSSNQSANDKGDGHTHKDWKVVKNGDIWEIWVRSERDGRDHGGRTYNISVEVSDHSGNVASTHGTVVVPHDMRDKHAGTDSSTHGKFVEHADKGKSAKSHLSNGKKGKDHRA